MIEIYRHALPIQESMYTLKTTTNIRKRHQASTIDYAIPHPTSRTSLPKGNVEKKINEINRETVLHKKE